MIARLLRGEPLTTHENVSILGSKSNLFRRATNETLILMHADKPVAEIKPVPPRDEQLRPFGLCAGEFVVPEDFDSPLPEDVLRPFEGG